MSEELDPTDPIRQRAACFPEVAKGTACTQSSFKAGKGTFLFIGPGPKKTGGYKAMFKLRESLAQAEALVTERPDRFEIGQGWVTARFSAEEPLPSEIWEPWLEESYRVTLGKS